MSNIPASERSLAARIAAEVSWANTVDRPARTAPARAALWQKFLDQADGDEVRAQHLWRAHFAALALRSARSRRQTQELRQAAATADAELDLLADEQTGPSAGEA